MKKPISVRAGGWLFLTAALAFVAVALVLGPGRSGAREYAWIFGDLEVLMGVSALWWVVGTLWHRARRGR